MHAHWQGMAWMHADGMMGGYVSGGMLGLMRSERAGSRNHSARSWKADEGRRA
jgi:hypothetical protein